MSEQKYEVSEYQLQRLAAILKQAETWLREIIPATQDETLLNGVCPFCRKPFIRKKPYQVFCDTPCQKAFNNAKRSTKVQRIMEESKGNNAVCVYCKSTYTIMPSDRGTAWAHYCQICRTSFQPWLDAHPEYQTPEQGRAELQRLIAEGAVPTLDKTGEKKPEQGGN